jgi:hypothetical protein
MLFIAVALSTAVLLSDLGGGVDRSAAASGFKPAFSRVQRDKGPIFRQGCLITGPKVRSGRCVYGNPRSRTVVVVFGDSHALQWTPALLKIAKRRNWRVVALLRGNCTPALAPVDRLCDEWRRNSLDRIGKLKPDLVILGTNTGRSVLARKAGRTLNRVASGRVLQAGMVKTMKRLLNWGSQVTLMRDLVVAPFDASVCVMENQANPASCSFTANRPGWLSFDYKAARKMSRVQIIDALPKVCAGGVCRATSGRILKFRDRAHLSATYVATLDRWLGRRLQRP